MFYFVYGLWTFAFFISAFKNEICFVHMTHMSLDTVFPLQVQLHDMVQSGQVLDLYKFKDHVRRIKEMFHQHLPFVAMRKNNPEALRVLMQEFHLKPRDLERFVDKDTSEQIEELLK